SARSSSSPSTSTPSAAVSSARSGWGALFLALTGPPRRPCTAHGAVAGAARGREAGTARTRGEEDVREDEVRAGLPVPGVHHGSGRTLPPVTTPTSRRGGRGGTSVPHLGGRAAPCADPPPGMR